MITSIDNNVIRYPTSLFEGKSIFIGIDSSKTNTAISVADSGGKILHYIEFNGEKVGTREEDTLKLCQDQRESMKIIFKNSKPLAIGIENIITKVENGDKKYDGSKKRSVTGMQMHESRFKITAVFMSIIAFFQDNFNMTPTLINNNTWKTFALPPEFRKRDIGKGSLAYFKSINSEYANCTDDVTDSICILRYLISINQDKFGVVIDDIELPKYNYQSILVSTDFKGSDSFYKFVFNPKLTLEQNAIFMSNTIGKLGEKIGKCLINIEDVELGDIYTKCAGTFKHYEEEILLVVIN